MLGAMVRSARPQAGVLAARICHHVGYHCRIVSAPAAATASAAVQHRPATQQPHLLTADAQRSATAAEDAWPAAQLSQLAEPANTAAPAAASAGHSRPHATDPRVAGGTFIRDLRIRDFALVEDQLIHLAPGLNVITGESGAGKSVLVEAFASILGAPAPEDCVRPPAARAVVEGTVQLSPAALAHVNELLVSLGVPRRGLISDPAASSNGSNGSHAAAPGPELRLRREIRREASGALRSRCSVNGAVTSLRVLREVGVALVDVNGQHSAQSLRNSDTQVALLDRIAGTAAQAARFGAQLRRLREAEGGLAALDALGDQDDRDALQALIDEVRAVGLEEGEERLLRSDLRRMESRRQAVEGCGLVRAALAGGGGDGGGGVEDGILAVERALKGVLLQEEAASAPDAGGDGARSDEDERSGEGAELVAEALDALEAARAALGEAGAKVEMYAQRFRFSRADYEDTADRLRQVKRLLKQHDALDSTELLRRAARAEADLELWYDMEGRRDELEAAAQQARAEVATAAAELSNARRAAAGQLRVAVEACLADLAMAGNRFDVRIGWIPDPKGLLVDESTAAAVYERGNTAYRLAPHGLDAVDFLLAAGPAEPLRPLAAVASGGEAARIMLALKAAPAAAAASVAASAPGSDDAGSSAGSGSVGAPIMILDELDSGVGSRLGQPVAAMLRRMTAAPAGSGAGHGTATQILCVSHIPQVAAHAEHHLVVRKAEGSDGRMLTVIQPLTDAQERATEIAAMLGLGLPAAEQMLAEAQRQ